MKEISVSEFRQRCLALMDSLPTGGLLITRHGHAVARILPVKTPSCVDLIGSVPLLVDKDDDLFSTGARWDAES